MTGVREESLNHAKKAKSSTGTLSCQDFKTMVDITNQSCLSFPLNQNATSESFLTLDSRHLIRSNTQDELCHSRTG